MTKLNSINRPEAGNGRLIILAVLVSMILFLARFGYDYGFSDQDEFLPLLIRLMESSTFSGDWFVNAQLDGFNIRLPLVLLMMPLASLVGIPATAVTLYVLSFSILAWALYRISLALNGSGTAAVMAAVVTLSITTLWTLGGNDIVSGMLVPSQIAWMFGLWALAQTLEGHTVSPGILCGLAIVFQPLVGVHMTAFCSAAVLLRVWESHNSWSVLRKISSAIWLPLASAVVASPVLGALIFEQLNNSVTAESLVILTEFRAPHHFIPGAFNATMSYRFLALSAVGLLSIWRFQDQLDKKTRHVLIGLLVFSASMLGLAYGNALWLHIDTITKLQLFKFSVLIKIMMIGSIGTAAVFLVPPRLRETLNQRLAGFPVVFLACMALVLVVTHGLRSENWTYRTIPTVFRGASYDDFLTSDHMDARLFDWVTRSTSPESVFAVPPDYSGFQIATRRAQYVSFKAFPYHDDDIKEWYRRLLSQTGYDEFTPHHSGAVIPAVSGSDAMYEFTTAYESRSANDLSEFARSESVDYVLRRSPLERDSTNKLMTEIYSNGNWYMYEFRTMTEINE